jgi:hypothetical protein
MTIPKSKLRSDPPATLPNAAQQSAVDSHGPRGRLAALRRRGERNPARQTIVDSCTELGAHSDGRPPACQNSLLPYSAR